MRFVIVVAILAFSCIAFAEPPPGYRLAWSDEFDGTELDRGKWTYWLPGARNDSTNVPEAVTVANGLLTLTTHTEGGKHFTGMISTSRLYEACYGYWEARIEFQDAPGMWSAFWSQTPTIARPIDDPAKAGVEIDFVEHRSVSREGKNIGGIVEHNLHWNGYGKEHRSSGKTTPDLDLGKGFHVYGFEWTDSEYRFYVDGQLTWTVTSPISQRPQFVILSQEVKNGVWAGWAPKEGYGTRTESKTRMIVDYVRHYTKAGN